MHDRWINPIVPEIARAVDIVIWGVWGKGWVRGLTSLASSYTRAEFCLYPPITSAVARGDKILVGVIIVANSADDSA